MDFKDIKNKEVENYIQIIKQIADKSKCIKQLMMNSKSPKYRNELLELFLSGEIPSSTTIFQMSRKITSIVIAMTTLYRFPRSLVSYEDMWNMYNELIIIENDFPFLNLLEEKELILNEILPL